MQSQDRVSSRLSYCHRLVWGFLKACQFRLFALEVYTASMAFQRGKERSAVLFWYLLELSETWIYRMT